MYITTFPMEIVLWMFVFVGKLSHCVQRVCVEDETIHYLLVDRASCRRKVTDHNHYHHVFMFFPLLSLPGGNTDAQQHTHVIILAQVCFFLLFREMCIVVVTQVTRHGYRG